MNCNFPELLAHDLDASNSVFATKRMSTGAPSVFSMNAVQDLIPVGEADLHLVDESVSVCLGEETYSPAPGPDIRYCHVPRQSTPLDPIDEGRGDRLTDDRTAIAHHAESDWDSLSSSSRPSSTMELPSTRLRDASVVTEATSTASGPLSAGLANNSGVAKSLPDVSWIDADSDSEESPSADSTYAAAALPLRRRLQFSADTVSNRETDTCLDTVDSAHDSVTSVPGQAPPEGDNYTLHAGRVAKRWPSSRRRGIIRFALDQTLPPDFPTCLPKDEISPSQAPVTPGTPPYSSPTLAPRQVEVAHGIAVVGAEGLETKPTSPPLPTSIRSGSCLGDSPASERLSTKHSVNAHQAPLSPRPPLPSSIQTWIEFSRDAATNPDEQFPGIPLPPDVVDNLRISITCFPDTMLLTSSLSIETIRSYSRKVKSCPSELKRDLLPPSSYSPKKWGFGRILSSRRSNASSCDRGSRDSSEETPASPWTALRAIFPTASEYLCDALYAHIVAYNYISSLQRGGGAPPPKPSHKTTEEGEVPRKAAALLGIREPDTSSVETAKSATGTSRLGPGERRDGALRDLLVGLSRCVVRLVVTLREGSGEVIGEGSGDVDLFLVRALCEVVRCSEER